MRRRWARVTLAGLLAAACARTGQGTEPPQEAAPLVAAADATPRPAEPPVAQTPEAAREPDAVDPRLGPPTKEEFNAWGDHPESLELDFDTWDRDHFDDSLRTYHELRCFHEALRSAGEERLRAGSSDVQWSRFERDWAPRLDAWLKQYFADHWRVMERSRFSSYFLEAHELLRIEYLLAYDERDRAKIEEAGAHWLAVDGKVRARVVKLGRKLPPPPSCEPPAKE